VSSMPWRVSYPSSADRDGLYWYSPVASEAEARTQAEDFSRRYGRATVTTEGLILVAVYVNGAEVEIDGEGGCQ
jgi:hypothetical protein